MIPEQFTKFARPLPEAICLLDANGHILAANPAAARFLAIDIKTLTNKSLFELVEDSELKVKQTLRNWSRSPELVPSPLKVRTGDKQIIACNCYGGLIQTKSGNSLAQVLVRFERREHFTTNFTALNEKIILLQREIMVRQRTEQALSKSKAEFEAMFNSITDAVMFVDIDRRIVMNNPAARTIFGYSDEELLGNTTQILYARKQDYLDQGRLRYTSDAVTQSGSYEARYKRKDGSLFWAETLGTQVKNANGEIIGFIGLVRDISKRKQAEEEIKKHREHLEELVNERTHELQAINKELEAFSYSVSHDLRAPLRAIDGFSEALQEDYTNILDDNGKHLLSRVRKNAHHMAELIDDLLQLSRITRAELKLQQVDLSELAKACIQRLREASPSRIIKVSITPGLNTLGDKTLVSAALENLLNNAWKYTGKNEHASIEFGSLNQNGETVYYIKDNGVGFSMQYYDKLFSAFQRLHKGSDFDGTGIGLATVQRIIHRHGGTIWARSELNKGATFYFTFTPPKSEYDRSQDCES